MFSDNFPPRGPYGFRTGPDREAVPVARRRILAVVRGWGLPLPEESLSDLALMASEVVTNALRHTGASCAVVVRWSGERLRVEVTDTEPTRPRVGDGALDAGSGRGLLLVDALAADWGSFPVAAGKVVWFEVASVAWGTDDHRLSTLVRAALTPAETGPAPLGASRLGPYVLARLSGSAA